MIRLIDLVNEDAGKEAKARGLHHIGFGRYADKNGNIVAKSEDGKLVDVPKGSEEEKPKKDSPEYRTAPPDVEKDYATSWMDRTHPGGLSSFETGSPEERQWRKLAPRETEYDPKYDEYVSRNPDGHLVSFKSGAIAVAFATGKKLKGYDFINDYDNSMEKLKQELEPQLLLLKRAEISAKLKYKVTNFIKDLINAFIIPARAKNQKYRKMRRRYHRAAQAGAAVATGMRNARRRTSGKF